MQKNKKICEYISSVENPYELPIGDMIVNIAYSDNNKKFNECMVNILKQKSQTPYTIKREKANY